MSVEEYSVDDPAFVKSSAKLQECPEADRPEYTFIGRSNVGKSSLINMLTGRKALAKTSSTPGKTQLINHFEMTTAGKPWYLVDLPGIGYAKVSKKDRASWERTSREYLTKRENLMSIMMLIDSRVPPQKIDMDFMVWMAKNGLSFAMIFTKVDKLTIAEREAFLAPLYRAHVEAMVGDAASFCDLGGQRRRTAGRARVHRPDEPHLSGSLLL